MALAIIAKPLIIVLFQYGQFSAFDALMTQRALVAYSLGLMGLIVVKVLAPGFYSRQDIKTPVRVAIVSLIATQIMNLLLITPLQHAGLSLSIGLGACVNASLLYWQLRKQKIYQPQPGWGMFLGKLLIAVLIMCMVLLVTLSIMPPWDKDGMLYRLLRLSGVVFVGAGSYFLALGLLGFRTRDFSRTIT